MEVAKMKVSDREVFGRRAMARVRASGQIPAIVYGRGGESHAISVPFREFSRHVWKHRKLFRLEAGSQVEEVYLQDLQWDNINDEILHADFLRVDFSVARTFTVGLVFVGNAKGSSVGIFDAKLDSIDINCPPTSLPESIRVVINDLDVGDSIMVKDLDLPENCSPVSDPEEMVCNVIPKAAELESDDEAAEGEAGEAPAEGGDEG
ncbi:MAG: 50S ribosomal protein L25 [Planctomycetota bacterium]|nr:MAG: 50S ribosomal protein L25 [Planctomycetota bacterium]